MEASNGDTNADFLGDEEDSLEEVMREVESAWVREELVRDLERALYSALRATEQHYIKWAKLGLHPVFSLSPLNPDLETLKELPPEYTLSYVAMLLRAMQVAWVGEDWDGPGDILNSGAGYA
jgi:hypothetical protein